MPVAAPPTVTATVDRDALLSLLHSCAKAAAGKRGAHGIPILRAARVTFGDGQIAMRATDLDLTIDCAGAVSEKAAPWSFVCDHARLLEIAKAMPEGALQLSCDEKALTVASGLASLTVPLSHNAEDYPADPVLGQFVHNCEIAAADLAWLLRQVTFAAGESGDFVFNGVFLTHSGSSVELAATNGHRLAIASISNVTRTGKAATFAIPRFVIDAIASREWEDDTTLSIAVHENHTVIRSGDYVLTGRRDNMTAPAYRNSIPKEHSATAVVGRPSLLAALKRVALTAGERSRCVVFEFESGRVTVSAQSERGVGNERLPADYSGEKLRIGFDWRYLLDYLPTIESPLVEMQMGADLEPVLIRPTEMPDSERELLYVVVPMRMT